MKPSAPVIIVTASTYPRWQDDTVPNFVHDQLLALKRNWPELKIYLLAPHDKGAKADEVAEFGFVRRFRYFWPAGLQRLVYPAILPNIDRNRWLYLQVPFLVIGEFFALLRLTREVRPDFIYSHWFLPQALVGWLVSTFMGVKHVYTSHSSDVQIARKIPFLGPALVRKVTGAAHRVTVVSRRSLEKLRSFFSAEQWALVENRVRIIPMGVETASFTPSEAQGEDLRVGERFENRNVLLFMGRLAEKKGVGFLLSALEKYVKADPDTLLVVAGDGPLLDSLKALTLDLGLDDFVEFVGYTVGKKKQALFRVAEIVVLPSIITDSGDAEGLPVVLMEALAAGKVCIATRESGADGVLDSGSDGFLIEQKSADAILDALIKVRDLTKEQKAEIKKNAIAKSRQFDWATIAQKHRDHLFE